MWQYEGIQMLVVPCTNLCVEFSTISFVRSKTQIVLDPLLDFGKPHPLTAIEGWFSC